MSNGRYDAESIRRACGYHVLKNGTPLDMVALLLGFAKANSCAAYLGVEESLPSTAVGTEKFIDDEKKWIRTSWDQALAMGKTIEKGRG